MKRHLQVALFMVAFAAGLYGQKLDLVRVETADHVRLDGMLYRAAKLRPTALLLVHGFGGNFYGGYFPALARAAAEQGYTTLALNMRDHDTGPKVTDFADNQADIAAGVEFLRNLGHARVALLGQSMGTNRVLFYEAATGDAPVAATILVSGPGNLFEWNVWQFGRDKAQATVDEALKLQAAGRDQELMLIDMGPLGKALYRARYLLSLRGPKARSDPYANIASLKGPVLIVQGRADKLIEPVIAQKLKDAAPKHLKVDVTYVGGADHQFRGQEPALISAVLDWLKPVAP